MEIQARRRTVIITLAVNATMQLIRNIMGNEEVDNPAEWLDRVFMMLMEMRLRGERLKPTRIQGYINHTIPNMNNNQFRAHFRMKPEIFEALANRLGPSLSKQNYGGRPVIPVRIQLLVTFWLLATPDSYRYVILFILMWKFNEEQYY